MQQNRQAEYFGGSDFLRRMDRILELYNEAKLNGLLDQMYELLCSYHDEVVCKMNDDELKWHDVFREVIDDAYEHYLSEIRWNDRIRRQARPGHDFLQSKVDFSNFKYLLNRWRQELQMTADNHNLVMQDKEDPGSALMNDKGY